MAPPDLSTPIFLLAMPQVQDPFFQKSVVLLLAHNEEGSFGFIVNRPTGVALSEILSGMEIDWLGDPTAQAFLGGPVQPETGTVLFGHAAERAAAQEQEVLPGIRISQHLADLQALAGQPPEWFRLFLGYAGWGSGQLVSEILRNDWLTAPVARELVFAGDPDSVWEQALRSAGVDPASLPAWTQSEDEGEAN